MDKKAQGVPWYLIALVLAAITLTIIILIVRPSFLFGKTTFQSQIFEQKSRLCAVQGAQAMLLAPGRRPPDDDKDGYPNSCDFCVGGDDGIDKNPHDGFPDDCQAPTKIVRAGDNIEKICNTSPKCKSNRCWDKERKVCVLG